MSGVDFNDGSSRWPMAPVLPGGLTGAERAEWLPAFEKAVARYYALCEQVIEVDRLRCASAPGRCVGVAGRCANESGRCQQECRRRCDVGCSVDGCSRDVAGADGRGSCSGGLCRGCARSSSGVESRDEGGGSAVGGDDSLRRGEGVPSVGTAGVGVDASASGAVKWSTLANRAKRRRRKAAKQRKQSEVDGEEKKSGVVPEWRRKEGGIGFHKGVFSECTQDVQLALRESRAQMLIAKNKAAVVEAEERARKTAAMLKSRMIEENVEKERLELEKKMKSLRESTALPQGYCETVLSALATPSLSDGTISPDSSISSAEVHKKDEAIRMLVGQCDEQRKETDKFKFKHQETEQRLLATIKRLEALETSTTAARKAREEAARERVRREREEMFSGKQAGEGWAGVRGARNVGKTEHNIDGTTKIVWSTDAEV